MDAIARALQGGMIMREILFRGKRTDNGEWVEGNLVLSPNADEGYQTIVIPCYYNYMYSSDYNNDVGFEKWYKVEPETVGQFTGLTDKNGKKIFEGDIVRVLGNQQVEDWKCVDYIGLVAFLDAGFCVIDGTIDNHGFRRYALPRLDFSLEVIGNIHDNPELLEVDDG